MNAPWRKLRIFYGGDLRETLEDRLQKIRTEVSQEPEDQLLNLNPTEYVSYLVQKHAIDPLVLDFDGVTVSDREDSIPAECFPNSYDVRPGRPYTKQVVTYHVPFQGDERFLMFTPSRFIDWSQEVGVGHREILFDVINFDNPDEVTRRAQEFLNNLRAQASGVTQDIERFNASLEQNVRSIVEQRKREILGRRSVLQSLGVPLKKVNPPPSLQVPIEKKRILVKPEAPSTQFATEPAIDKGD